MASSRTFEFKKRLFQAGELARGFRRFLQERGLAEDEPAFTIERCLPDGTRSVSNNLTADALEEICDPSDPEVRFISNPVSTQRVYVGISGDERVYRFHVGAPKPGDVSAISYSLRTLLELEPPPPKEPLVEAVKSGFEEALRPLQERLEKLEQALAAPSRRLRAFLSYRFSDENELAVLRLSQFLAALDVDVITGSTYEPRKITEKVLSKLREPLDVVVVLVTAVGESMWTRDEVGAAVHHGLAVVPIVEEGAKFEPGLFGDVEFIRYAPGHIGDSFLKLVQALSFLRAQKLAGGADLADTAAQDASRATVPAG